MLNSTGTPLVLLVNSEEWASRSFESILKPQGYVVLKAYTGHQGLGLAQKIRPDLIMIERRLPDMDGGEVSERMRELPTVRPSTPILAFTTGALTRKERLGLLKAGAWDVLNPPFDPEEVVARVECYVDAKRDTDAAMEQSDVDPLTGLYNLHGTMKRMTELLSAARRNGRDLACVVVGPAHIEGNPAAGGEAGARLPEGVMGDGSEVGPDVTKPLADMMRATTRGSDAIGRIGDTDFVIVAPDIDEGGATRLAERLLEALEEHAKEDESLRTIQLKAGIYAVSRPEAGTNLVPESFLTHATTALRKAQLEGNGLRILAFSEE